MASAETELYLQHSLLLLSEIPAGRVFNGRAAAVFPRAAFERMLARRVVVERPPVNEVAAHPACDRECSGRLVQRAKERIWAVCPLGVCPRDELAAEELRHFEVSLAGLCRCLREDNGWSGEPVAQLADGLWVLGRARCRNPPPSRLVLLALGLRETTIATLQIVARGAARDGPLTILTPTDPALPLPARQTFTDAGMPLVPVCDALSGQPDGTGFHLNPGMLSGPPPAGPRLVIDIATGAASFDAQPLMLAPQPFDLLVVLVRHALTSTTFVQRRSIEDAMWGSTPAGHHLSDVVRRLRAGFGAGGIPDPRTVIETKARHGYRLNLRPDEIELA